MIGKQTEKHFVFTVSRLSRNEVDSIEGFQTRRRRKRSEAGMRLITTSPRNTEEVGTPPVVSEFAAPNYFRVSLQSALGARAPKTQTAFGGIVTPAN